MPRAKPHFKIFTTARNHRKLPAYSDNALFALWARLGVEAIERFADRTGDVFILHEAELSGVAGGCSRLKSIRLLEKLTQCSPISFTVSGRSYSIHFPNLASKHGFKHQNGTLRSPNANTDPDPDKEPPVIPPRRRRSEKKSREPAGEATRFPKEGFTDEMKRELAASPSLKDLSPAQFRHALQNVADWSTGDQKGPRLRIDWVATVRNHINRGWALDGMPGVPKGTPPRKGSAGPTPENPRNKEIAKQVDSGELRRIEDIPAEELETMQKAAEQVKAEIGSSLSRARSQRPPERPATDAGDNYLLDTPTREDDAP